MVKNWQKTWATFEGEKGSANLPGLCLDLQSQQQKTWEDFRQGTESLKNIRERDLDCGSFSVRLQYNPRRIKSSTADDGSKNHTERRCFLCLDHLPEDQKGILYRNEYLILCNPMPVLSSHFTVSHVDHRPQAIEGHLEKFLLLMADLGPGWIVLYNGPKCGASAPDHFHFQVALSGKMPIERYVQEQKRHGLVRQVEDALLYRVKGLGREVVVIEGNHPEALENGFRRFLHALRKFLLLDEEPMINIAGFCDGRKWRLVVFPRRRHRPEAFFMEGEARVVVSPGVIDMGGVLITPLERDFERLDTPTVEGIYKEVSLEGEIVEKVFDVISKKE